MVKIRNAADADWNHVWPIVQETFDSGDTYPYAPGTTKKEAYQIWMASTTATYIAIKDECIVGTYYLKPNQPGLGSHVCNAGYIVAVKARGRGIGRAMCAHSLKEAVILGFKAMQYNLVVSTNINAIELWKDMGFEMIGTLPKAFNHSKKGLVDAHIMYQLIK